MEVRSSADLRALIVAEALSWRGTPYHHQQSTKGVGCDCLGLVRGIWRALYGAEPARAPNYSRDWAESKGEETLRAACEAFLRPVTAEETHAGDVLLFRMTPRAVAKHLGVLIAPGRMVHAFEGSGVIEQSVQEFITRRRHVRIVSAYAFPGV